MALVKPTIGQNTWGAALNTALDFLNTRTLKDETRNPITASSTAIDLVLADAGSFLYITGTDTWQPINVPANADVAFEIGTVITFVTVNSTFITLAAEGVSVYGQGQGTANNYMGSNNTGVTQLIKIDTNSWILTGPNVWQD